MVDSGPVVQKSPRLLEGQGQGVFMAGPDEGQVTASINGEHDVLHGNTGHAAPGEILLFFAIADKRCVGAWLSAPISYYVLACCRSSHSPSPPAEQATPSQHQRGQSCTDAAQLRDTAKYQPDRKRGGLGQKENPAEAGQGLILEGNQDEDTATTLIAAVLEA